jgi:alpha-galactosidase
MAGQLGQQMTSLVSSTFATVGLSYLRALLLQLEAQRLPHSFRFLAETEVHSVADSLVSTGLASLGYDLILLDDCWSATTRDANGNLQPDPTRFPSGIPALVEYIHGKGLRLGLYTSAGSEACKNHRLGSGGHFQQDADWYAANNIDLLKADYCHSDPALTPQQTYSNFSAALNATGKPIYFATCEWGEDSPQEWAPAIAQSYRATPGRS